MSNFRSIALAVGGVAVIAAAAVFTLSLTLVAGAIVTASLFARMLSGRRQEQRAYARADNTGKTEMRIWNDGRGTIIDL